MKHLHLKQNAVQLLQKQQFSKALDECSKYCKKAKKDPEGFLLLGSIYGALGDLGNAIKALKDAAKLQPTMPHIFFNLGVAYQQLNEPENAVVNLQKAIKLKPNFFEAIYNLGHLYLVTGNPEKALDQFNKALALKDDFPGIYSDIATILVMQNEHGKAIEYYIKAISLDPNIAEIYVNLGKAQTELDNNEEAEKSYLKALSLNKQLAIAHIQLGILRFKQERTEDAITSLQKAVELDSKSPVAYNNLAIALKERCDYEEARKAAQTAIKLKPDYAQAYHTLGNIVYLLGDIDEATEKYLKALEYLPQSRDINFDIGNILLIQGRHAEAVKYLQQAVDLDPGIVESYVCLATGLVTMNKLDEALEIYDKALAIDPENPDALGGIASIYERRREYQKAADLISPYIKDTAPIRLAAVYGDLSLKLKNSEHAIQVLENTLTEDSLSTENKIDLHYTLGKIYDKSDLFENAFNHYHGANELFRKKNRKLIEKYSIDIERDRIDEIKNVFSREHFQKTSYSNCQSERPVFVVGMPRSGTTLTESIIASHPLAHGAGELRDIFQIRLALQAELGSEYPDCMKSCTDTLLDKMAEHYLQRLSLKSSDAIRVVDKMPHNFMQLGLIAQLFPKAKIIHIQRNPIDNCLSIYFQRFNTGHTYASSLTDLGNYYQLYLDLMAHWQKTLPISIMNIRYDELVSDQETITRQMIDYCGLEWDNQCLAFHKTKRDVITPSYDQVSQPMYSKSSGRWKNYQNYINELIDTLADNAIIDKSINT